MADRTIHLEPHELTGQTVRLRSDDLAIGGVTFEVEDWWDRVSGGSWMQADGNVACLMYATRVGRAGLRLDDEVVYGQVIHPSGYLSEGCLVHVSELVDAAAAPARG